MVRLDRSKNTHTHTQIIIYKSALANDVPSIALTAHVSSSPVKPATIIIIAGVWHIVNTKLTPPNSGEKSVDSQTLVGRVERDTNPSGQS